MSKIHHKIRHQHKCLHCGADISYRRYDAKYCGKKCKSAFQFARNPEKCKQLNRQWFRDHPERARHYRTIGYETQRNSRLLREYGITAEQWNAWFQKGICPISKVPFDRNFKSRSNWTPIVHHNHQTGHVEGLWSNAMNMVESRILLTPDPIRTCKNLLRYFEQSTLFHQNGKNLTLPLGQDAVNFSA